ncbi:UNVERIFIED_CONTAM: hypothetical protein Slati_3721500 [Sesamum latifolium]|uniref:Reverse transcriptase domain-containing protein n=1 Tax=Sesamum latifolium TaxID=2727402 RepID=A0AAW2U458_9LAMI
MMANAHWFCRWPNAVCLCSTPRTSDHSPLLLRGYAPCTSEHLFQFDNFLATAPSFIDLVQGIWRHDIHGKTMYAITRKLKALKPVLRAKRKERGSFRQCHNEPRSNGSKAARRVSLKVFQITNGQGTRLTVKHDVVAEFISFFENLLGGHRQHRLLDINFLRPWARHVLTAEEADLLVEPIRYSEVKMAVFAIVEEKAPRPDGFSAGFYKAAWSIIGNDITANVQEFLFTGKLLKQVNATLLTLIPKVSTPTSVTDYRPISCCNVFYKIITKIIVQRMHGVMGKLVSPSQNAFVPGRRISYNILLAQELFSGYNRRNLPPRCALKECLSTAAYSVSLNGELHGFFKGARGLRQGDPMSPYLFVLAMEVLNLLLLQRVEQSEHFQFHWLCKDVYLLSLCFADDLLLFCKVDEHSVILFRDGLQLFAEWSGLQANVSMS